MGGGGWLRLLSKYFHCALENSVSKSTLGQQLHLNSFSFDWAICVVPTLPNVFGAEGRVYYALSIALVLLHHRRSVRLAFCVFCILYSVFFAPTQSVALSVTQFLAVYLQIIVSLVLFSVCFLFGFWF